MGVVVYFLLIFYHEAQTGGCRTNTRDNLCHLLACDLRTYLWKSIFLLGK